jgi:hypothetical protein
MTRFDSPWFLGTNDALWNRHSKHIGRSPWKVAVRARVPKARVPEVKSPFNRDKRAELKSRFNTEKRADVKAPMNDLFAKMMDAVGSETVLVLDCPKTWRSTERLSQLPSLRSVIIANDEVKQSEPRLVSSLAVTVFASKLGKLLEDNPKLKVDAAMLDFCAQMKTCESEIKETISRLNASKGAPFLVTLNYTRGGESVEVSRAKIMKMFSDSGKFSEEVKTTTSNGMVTFMWIVRNKFSL